MVLTKGSESNGPLFAMIIPGKSEAVTFLAVLNPRVGDTRSAAATVIIRLCVVVLATLHKTLFLKRRSENCKQAKILRLFR